MSKEEILKNEVSEDELKDVNGGGVCTFRVDEDRNNCVYGYFRNIYGGNGFPNCAQSVTDGSWCDDNDACYQTAVSYLNMKDCSKAWE